MEWWVSYNYITDSDDSDLDIYGCIKQFKSKKSAKRWIKNVPHNYKNMRLFKEVK